MTYHRAHARNSDPETSVEAADSVNPRIRESQQEVLERLRACGPLTDDQLVERLPRMSPSGVRSRRSELVERGLVRDSGARAFTKSNRKTIIWEVAP